MGHFYLTAELVMQDISKNACKVVCKDDLIHGVLALFEEKEPTLIEKNDFVKCGTIIYEDGTPRIAYQWCERL